jgi:tetratricopeptide (TPR) repeat protein
MKAEHRKELQTNTLAQTIEHTVQRIKEGPSKNTVLVLILIAVVVALFLVWHWFSQTAHENDSERWVQWDNLMAPEQVDAFLKSEKVEGTAQARLARFLEARRSLYEGVKDIGFNRGRAIDSLKKAEELYRKLSEEASDRPLLEQEALLGAGRACESLGNFDDARKFYGKVADKYPDTARGQSAKKQLARLDDPDHAKDLKDLVTEFRPPPALPESR